MINQENNNTLTISGTLDPQTLYKPPQHNYIQIDRFTSAYFHDFTQEQYKINQCFQACNFTYLRQLPNQFYHKQILNHRLDRVKNLVQQQQKIRRKPYEMKQQELRQKKEKKKLQKIGTLGFFQLFPYRESPYYLAKQLANQTNKQNQIKRRQISDLEFRPSHIEKKGKYQDPFSYKDKTDPTPKDNSNYLYPFHFQQDSYNQYIESKQRQRRISEMNRLAGPFLPSMKEKTLCTIHKSQILQILNDIQLCLRKNLQDYAYIIGVNKKDFIEILFEGIHQKDLLLRTFMSNICEHENLTKYQLKRDLLNYGIIENNYILFTLIPPWTNSNINLITNTSSIQGFKQK